MCKGIFPRILFRLSVWFDWLLGLTLSARCLFIGSFNRKVFCINKYIDLILFFRLILRTLIIIEVFSSHILTLMWFLRQILLDIGLLIGLFLSREFDYRTFRCLNMIFVIWSFSYVINRCHTPFCFVSLLYIFGCFF